MTLVMALTGHLIGIVTYFLPCHNQHRLEPGDFFLCLCSVDRTKEKHRCGLTLQIMVCHMQKLKKKLSITK